MRLSQFTDLAQNVSGNRMLSEEAKAKLAKVKERQDKEKAEMRAEEKRLSELELCKTCTRCVNDCKQFSYVQVLDCPKYKRKKKN